MKQTNTVTDRWTTKTSLGLESRYANIALLKGVAIKLNYIFWVFNIFLLQRFKNTETKLQQAEKLMVVRIVVRIVVRMLYGGEDIGESGVKDGEGFVMRMIDCKLYEGFYFMKHRQTDGYCDYRVALRLKIMLNKRKK